MSSKLKWTEQEQLMLKNQVNGNQGRRKWVVIATKMNEVFPERQRTSKQCRQKYINHVQFDEGVDNQKWSPEEQHFLFQQYLKNGSQWKLISSLISGKSQNAVKNKFYGKIRKLVRKLNNICKQRINKSNKPLRDQSIMRIIDVKQGFQNLPQNLISQSSRLKEQLLLLAEADMNKFQQWDLINQTNVVNLIRKIHKFNINSRYYCSRKRKSLSVKKVPKQPDTIKEQKQQRQSKHKESKQQNQQIQLQQQQQHQQQDQKQEMEKQKSMQFKPIILYQCTIDSTLQGQKQ